MTFKEAIDHIKEEEQISMPVIAELLGVTYTNVYLRYHGKAKGKLRLTTVLRFYKKFGIVLDPYTEDTLDTIIKARS